MKFFKRNKIIVAIIAIIVISVVYFGVDKAIEKYSFVNNDDIVFDGEENSQNDELEIEDEVVGNSGREIASEEVDVELEEISSENEGMNASGEEQESAEDSVDFEDATEVEDGEVKDDEEAAGPSEKIYVYITGEVINPGVVTLEENSRIVDAINAAGGITSSANISKVNLVYMLEDGMKVNIPSDKDLKDNPNFEYITMSSGDGKFDGVLNEVSSEDSSVNLVTGQSGSSGTGGTGNKYGKVNINSATQTELETLPRNWSFSCFEDY